MRSDDMEHMLGLLLSPAYFFDLESHRILAVNTHFEQLMGYTREELLNMSLEDLRSPEDLPNLKRALLQSPPEGVVQWRYTASGGKRIYVLLSYRNNVLMDQEGSSQAVRLVVVSRWGAEPMQPANHLFGANLPTA